jgi:hypothetical protein
MMPIIPVGKSDQKAGVGNSSHLLANPLRLEKSRGPSTDPARCRNGCSALRRASSSCSRMIRPRGTPAFLEAASSHPAKSSGSRTVIVLLICPECNADCSPPTFRALIVGDRFIAVGFTRPPGAVRP